MRHPRQTPPCPRGRSDGIPSSARRPFASARRSTFPSTAAFVLALAASVSLASSTRAQQVVVYDDLPPIPADVDVTAGQERGTNQGILVIPVVGLGTPFDPDDNLLDDFDPLNPDLHQDLIDKFDEVDDFWVENSYDEVSFDVTILDRYYQMPRPVGDYFNPDYVTPELVGTEIQGTPTVDVPGGQARLLLHISDADETTIDLTFDSADSPYTIAELEAALMADLAVAGGKLSFTFVGCGVDCRFIRLRVPSIWVRAGTFIQVDFGASDAAVLDALGLDRPTVDLGAVQLTGQGAELPYTSQAGDVLTLTVANDVDPPETYDWTMGADVFNTPADFIAAHGATHAEVAMTVVGGELRFTAAPAIAGPFTTMELSGPAELLDRLGLDASTEADGTINLAKQNTIKGDRRIIAGQAVGAYVLNELTRDPGAPGPDPFPNMAIDAANDAALTTLFENQIDPFRIVALIFLDAPNKRAGASGTYLPVGLRNGGYTFEHMTRAHVQIQFDFSAAATIAHETGHNIGLYDLYNNSNGEYDPSLRYPQDWDVMHAQGDKAHTGTWHKEITNGWLSASGADVATMSEPATSGVSETEGFVLTPLDIAADDYDDVLAGVPAGRAVAKTIRLPLGLGIAAADHFLLVQNRQAGELFSQNLPMNPAAADPGGVYITDAISRSSFDFFKPEARNFVHPLTDRPLLPGANVSPVIDAAPGPDIGFLMTYPAYDGLEVDIVGEIPGPGAFADRPAYLVDVTREQKDYLELGLTPWGAPPWESLDIWLEHGDKAEADLSDVPLAGNGEPARWAPGYDQAANGGDPLNWIRAKVTNSGTVDATDVQIRVRVNQPGGMGDSGTWVVLDLSDPEDIPAGESRILQVGWNPSVNRHTCVQVEVFRWTAVLGDRDPWNNRTQENVNLFQPTASSPWGATPFSFEIANGRSFPMEVLVEPEGLPRGYRLTLDESFVEVPSETSVTVTGILELDDTILPPPTAPSLRDRQDPIKPRVDVFHLNAAIIGDEFQIPAGGITYVSIPSVRVDVDYDVLVDGSGNIVVTGTTEPPFPGIDVEIQVRYPSGRIVWVPVTTRPDGSFGTTIPPEEDGEVRVSVAIPPGQPAAPTDGGIEIVDPSAVPGAPGVPGANRLDLFLGAFVTDDSLPLDSGLEWGVRYRRAVAAPWNIEAELGFADTDSATGDGLLIHGQLQAVWQPGGTWARPFLLGGLGVARFDGRGRSDTSLLATLGAGTDLRWTARLGLRLDLRYVWVDSLLSSGSTHNWQVLWGPTFTF